MTGLSDKRTEIQQKIGKIVRNTNISSSEKCSQIDAVIKEAVKKLKEELRNVLCSNSKCECSRMTDKYANISELKIDEIFGEKLI